MTSPKSYTYDSLTIPGQFRLLHLEPGTGDIHFTLSNAHLDDNPAYEAISYCWGDAKDTRVVHCHGVPINITYSLFTALQRLRRLDETRIVWADAVCINQTDTDEKTEQVKLMGRIYSQPSRVLIWLGEDKTGLDGLKECLAGAQELLPPSSQDGSQLLAAAKTAYFEASELRRAKKPNFNDHNWQPFASILCRAWFDRTWIIQEAILAPEHVERLVLCGDLKFDWNVLADVCYRIASHGFGLSLSGTSVLNAKAPSMFHFMQENNRPVIMFQCASMISLLQHYQKASNIVDAIMAATSFKATDPRDHVYGLLGSCAHTSGIMPDYNLTAPEVFCQVSEAVLVGDQNLRLLALAPHMAFGAGDIVPKRIDGLPSWVPDFSCEASVSFPPLVSYTIRPQLYHAGDQVPEVPVRISESDGRKLLHLRGRIIDTVDEMAQCLPDAPMPTENDILPKTGYPALLKRYILNWLRECQRVAFGSSSVITEAVQISKDDGTTASQVNVTVNPWSEEFANTLICAMTLMRDAAPPEAISAVKDFVTYLEAYFTPGWVMTESFRERMLTDGPIVEHSIGAQGVTRKFCRTTGGRLGQVRKDARKGDVVCVITGAEVPFILRKSEVQEGAWVLIGDAYISGVMQGEALADDRYETEDIVLC
ncbi:heterokaryon incompatibility protein-domain-containing protein [Plectosphaerella plurivora]|uniref:Heterokaryon incompatibility protein-domain-containing protein n=1 Tax=Plectosphaerella plurivora TaxID=936078 RepID=A0A9P9ACQ2_9PEZI|nr:heterokaryon incompatibility protein-domain-containing protein [Plectosphaerella plurivora]